ncbi:Uncharacterised protein [Escherichia coli]|uniref:Uncharacterized protein n=1 Tax=Escherichia coli TaxID=562 RepID=A0A376P9Z8_ECOLX|nr:Uncharacterised protein [Escherichia coli]
MSALILCHMLITSINSNISNDIYLDSTFKYISYFTYYIGGNEQILFLIYAVFIRLHFIFNKNWYWENYITEINNFYTIGLVLSFYSFYFYYHLIKLGLYYQL